MPDPTLPLGCYISRSTGERFDTNCFPEMAARMPDDVVAITQAKLFEITEGLNAGKTLAWSGDEPVLNDPPPPTRDQLLGALRCYRTAALLATDSGALRHRDQRDLGVPTTLSDDQFRMLMTYRQALRDLPDTISDGALANPKGAIPPCPVQI